MSKKILIYIIFLGFATGAYITADEFKDWIFANHPNGEAAVGIGSFNDNATILLSSKDGKHKAVLGLQVTDENSEVYLIHQVGEKKQTKILSSISLIESTIVKNKRYKPDVEFLTKDGIRFQNEPVFYLMASDMSREYSENFLSANAKYKHGLTSIVGFIGGFEYVNPMSVLKLKTQGCQIACILNAEHISLLTNANKNDIVGIVGKVTIGSEKLVLFDVWHIEILQD